MSLATDYKRTEQQHESPPQPTRPGRLARPVTMPLWALILGAVVAMGIGGLGGDSSEQAKTAGSAPASTVRITEQGTVPAPQSQAAGSAPAPQPAPAPAPKGPATSFEDGTHKVGEDIAAGQYKTDGPPASNVMDMCYWSRNRDATGEFASIITNGIVQGPARVTVKSGEYLDVSGGCTWTKVA
ncbi:MAG: hypothetical protein M3O70_16435 [Actinomycetota bacterium]|nr:hypothetical protein [Actinomycetota bacterium]